MVKRIRNLLAAWSAAAVALSLFSSPALAQRTPIETVRPNLAIMSVDQEQSLLTGIATDRAAS